MIWNEEIFRIVDEMKAAGKTRKEIAEKLGATLGGLAGALCRRKGYKKPPRGTKGNMPGPKKTAPKPRIRRQPKGLYLIKAEKCREAPTLVPQDEVIVDAEKKGYTILSVGYSKCHWPIGKDSDGVQLFCGEDGFPWCENHRVMAFDLKKSRLRSA